MFVKGAPEEIMARCFFIATDEGGRRELEEEDLEKFKVYHRLFLVAFLTKNTRNLVSKREV